MGPRHRQNRKRAVAGVPPACRFISFGRAQCSPGGKSRSGESVRFSVPLGGISRTPVIFRRRSKPSRSGSETIPARPERISARPAPMPPRSERISHESERISASGYSICPQISTVYAASVSGSMLASIRGWGGHCDRAFMIITRVEFVYRPNNNLRRQCCQCGGLGKIAFVHRDLLCPT